MAQTVMAVVVVPTLAAGAVGVTTAVAVVGADKGSEAEAVGAPTSTAAFMATPMVLAASADSAAVGAGQTAVAVAVATAAVAVASAALPGGAAVPISILRERWWLRHPASETRWETSTEK